MKEEIIVSICCLTYNHEKYIEQAIKSFLMQKTNFKFEILIHDDASTDNTVNIIKKYENQYPDKIKSIYQKENQYSKGVKVSEILYKKVKGKYVAICEGDDYWTDPYKLQKQFDYMEKNQNCGICFHSVEVLDDITKKIVDYKTISPFSKDTIVMPDTVILGGGDFVGTNSIFCKASLLKETSNFYKKCLVGDYPLQILGSCNDYAYYINEKMSVYRINVANSWTSKIKNASVKDKRQKKILLNENLIEMLLSFNEYSKGKYKEAIEMKKEELEFEILFLKKDLKNMKSIKYRKYYNKLSTTKKLRLGIKYFLKLMLLFRK